jgi:SNF2 family DNA or RNA helicase
VAHAERAGDLITVATAWTEKELIKLIPGARWSSDERVWTVPLTWVACQQLRGVFGANVTIGEQLTLWSWAEFTQRVQPTTELRTVITCADDALLAPNLHPFQSVGATFIGVSGNTLIGDELGLGKTITALAALSEVVDALPALVICPNSTKLAWERQAAKWSPEVTPYVIRGGAAGRRKLLAQAKLDPSALVIINVEAVRLLSRLAPFGSIRLRRCRECDPRNGEVGLTTSRCETHAKELNGFGFKTVILDEAHKIKEPKSQQTRACWAVGHDPSVRRRWLLTGTPIANHVGDLWSLMHFAQPDEYPTKSRFIDRYGLMSWNAFGGLDVVGLNPATRDEFYRVFYPRYRRTLKALVLDQLPRVVRATRWVELVPKQERAYRELERQLITQLDDGTILISPNNLVRATRLLQLAASYATVEHVEQPLTAQSRCECCGRGLDRHDPACQDALKIVVTLTEPSSKLDALEDVLDELGPRPVVVAAQSRQLIELAGRRLEKRGLPFGYITGPVSEYERQRTVDRFNAGDLGAVLLTIDAGGTGVDGLQVADTLVVLQRSWKMISNVQLEGRVNRIGSERHDSINVIDIVAQGTIEETVLFPRLTEKLGRLEEINRDRARLAAAGVTSDPAPLLDEESRIMMSNLGAP